MENIAKAGKRKQIDLDSSDSESEITFNSSAKKSKKSEENKSKMGNNEDFINDIKRHFDTKTAEITSCFTKEIEPIKEKIQEHSASISAINVAIKRLEEGKSTTVPSFPHSPALSFVLCCSLISCMPV